MLLIDCAVYKNNNQEIYQATLNTELLKIKISFYKHFL